MKAECSKCAYCRILNACNYACLSDPFKRAVDCLGSDCFVYCNDQDNKIPDTETKWDKPDWFELPPSPSLVPLKKPSERNGDNECAGFCCKK